MNEENPRMFAVIAGSMIILCGGSMPGLTLNRPRRYDDGTPCKNCGRPTQHKKGCCSGDCFRAWKAKK